MSIRRSGTFVGFLLLAFMAGFIGSRFAPGLWYAQLAKPPFNPPDWVFAPVWSMLFAMMGVAAGRAWLRGGRNRPIGLWLVQLVFNAGWSWLFFGLRRPDLALLEIVVLLSLIVATAVSFWRIDRLAGVLMVPYAAWVAFAGVLNAALWMLNRTI